MAGKGRIVVIDRKYVFYPNLFYLFKAEGYSIISFHNKHETGEHLDLLREARLVFFNLSVEGWESPETGLVLFEQLKNELGPSVPTIPYCTSAFSRRLLESHSVQQYDLTKLIILPILPSTLYSSVKKYLR